MGGYTRHTCTRTGCSDPVVARKLCRKHYQTAWKAGQFKNQPNPHRTPAPQVCPPEHKHAVNRTCYVQHQCRCDPCRDANRDRYRARSKAIAYGRYDTGLVDATPVREHVLKLAEVGIGYKRLAELAGIGITAARSVLWGRQEPGPRYGEIPKRIKRETAEKILAVQPTLENLAGGMPVPARPTVRRIEALIAFGYSQNRIANLMGWHSGNLAALRHRYGLAVAAGDHTLAKVNAATHRLIADIYEQHCLVPPPATDKYARISVNRSRRLGREKGWPLPMDWAAVDDDFDTDDPPTRSTTDPWLAQTDPDDVDEIAVQRAVEGHRTSLTPAEFRAAVLELHRQGNVRSSIATTLRCNTYRVQQVLADLEQEEVA